MNVDVFKVTIATYTFNVTEPRELVAHFSLNSYEISAINSPAEGGAITGAGTFLYGSSATLTATASTGYSFVKWTENGETVSSVSTYTFTVTGERTLVANYKLNTYLVSVLADPMEGGAVSGAGSFVFGSTAVLTASSASGYTFSHWTENGTLVSTTSTHTITVTGNRTITAHFIPDASSSHWTPNVSSYPFTATLIGVIQIEGEEQRTTLLEVGAFCNDECRGSGRPTYVPQMDRYILFMSLYGEDGDELYFRLFDHETNQESDLTCLNVLTFMTNVTFGSGVNLYVLNFTSPLTGFHFVTAGDWSEPSNWSGGALPGTGDEVFIDAPCLLDASATVASLTVSDGQSLTLQSGTTLAVTGTLTSTSAAGLVLEDGAQLVNATENVAATVKKDVVAYGSDNPDGWYTIASPVNGMAIAGSGFVAAEYDLYRFAETEPGAEKWENHKDAGTSGFTVFENGRGYLYARGDTVPPAFTGMLNASAVTYTLTCTDPNDSLCGFHLIGNPFPHAIYKGAGGAIDDAGLASGYYTLTNEGAWHVHTCDDAIQPGQGILVKASAPTVLTIAKSTASASGESGETRIQSQGGSSRICFTVTDGLHEDRAYACFGQGTGLDKKGGTTVTSPSIAIVEGGREYAIAHVGDGQTRVDLRFKGREGVTYVLRADVMAKGLGSLVLADHATGTEVDLSQQSEYTFTVTGKEPEVRFTVTLEK